ncbi:MAG: hypothetical protein EPN50_10230 [Chloroflexota bacterium]|nr:MAG: hypothetical protein EPN50_10230 [Chloroflexota bacterium]
MSPPILPTLGAAVVLALAAASVLLTLYGPEPPGMTSADTLFFLALSVPLPVALGAMGWLIAWRSQGHPVGLLMIGSAVCLAVMFASSEYQLVSAEGPTGLPGATFAGWLSSWMTTPALAMLGIFVPLLFPTGRFLTPRWRRLGLILVGVVVVGTVTTAFLPGSAGNGGNFDNPFGISQAAPLLEVLNMAFDLCAPVAFGAGLISLALRFRRGDVRERRQIKLFAYPAVFAIAALLVSIFDPAGLGDVAWQVALLALTGIPVAIAVAIVRHGLFDIDRLISRTLAYAVLTALLLALYGLVILAAEPIVTAFTGGTDLAVAVATLAAAIVFQPLRRRIQGVVDRRFDRARYDAELTAAAFASALRTEVELEAVRRDLVEVVSRTMRPVSAGLWLRER